MELNLEQDIRSVTELKRQTKEVLAHAQQTQRPVVITLNGRADAVILSAAAYERMKKSVGVAKSFSTMGPPEHVVGETIKIDPVSGQTFRNFKAFWQEFKHAYKVNA